MLDPIDVRFFKQVAPDIGQENENDINARCPVCGDSKNKNKKRLHLYKSGDVTLVHCFNGDCTVHNNMYNFLKLYFPDYLKDYKREKFQFSLLNKPEPIEISNQLNLTEELKLIDINLFTEPLNDECIDYLLSRNINPRPEFRFCNNDVKINDKFYKLKNKIIIPFEYNNTLSHGFYSRDIKQKEFITFSPNLGYKVWNWFRINKKEPVYIFEGIFDALSSGKKNIIACCSADLHPDRLKELSNPIFCFDNDVTGHKKMLELCQKYPNAKFIDYKDFEFKDLNEALQKGKLDFNKFNFLSGFRASLELRKRI